jgi:site-specific recombinase XerD
MFGIRVHVQNNMNTNAGQSPIQDYLGHRNIQHTVRYTTMAPQRFESFWND